MQTAAISPVEEQESVQPHERIGTGPPEEECRSKSYRSMWFGITNPLSP